MGYVLIKEQSPFRMRRLRYLLLLTLVLACFLGGCGAPQVPPLSTIFDDPTPLEECPHAVSVDAKFTNSDCQALCAEEEGINGAHFLEHCGFIKAWYSFDDVAQSTGCYTGLIYGYSVHTFRPELVGFARKTVGTAHACQSWCQENQPLCAWWIWMRPGLYNFQQPNCHLKAQAHIDNAFYGSAENNTDWCPPRITRQCHTDARMRCGGTTTCIWCNERWLGGPPWCEREYLDKHYRGPDGQSCWNVRGEDDPLPPAAAPEQAAWPVAVGVAAGVSAAALAVGLGVYTMMRPGGEALAEPVHGEFEERGMGPEYTEAEQRAIVTLE